MAHLSQDEHMIEAFRSGADIHSATAAKIYGIPVEEVTGDMRRKAKTANFGIIYSDHAIVRGYAERNAINAPIQGSAADIIKVAMVRIYNRFEEEGLKSKMILQVHDELNFNVCQDEQEKVRQIVLEEMENAIQLQVPLIADCGEGKNWLEAH